VSRRVLTLLLAAVLAVGLALAAAVTPVPYVSLGPGPAYDTLGSVGGVPVITVTGRQTYPTDGHLDLTTVGVTDRITLAEALQGWLSQSTEVVPREVVFPPDQTSQQTDQQNAKDMVQSQDAATSAALLSLGVPAKTTVSVASVQKGAPADGKLRTGDVLTSVDGKPVTSSDALRRLIGARAPGAQVTIGYLRAGTAGSALLTTIPSKEANPRALVGISPDEKNDFPVKVTIALRDVGGPSAGLMFALGIIDKLDPESLTGGRSIAGTGEISSDGTVGPIGGIAEKLIGARRRGATAFLVPTTNCGDAKVHPPAGLRLIKVQTLKGALAELAALRGGAPTTPC